MEMSSKETLRRAGLLALVLLSLLPVSLGAEESFTDLPFRSIGPAVMGGRIDSIAVVPGAPSTLYVGAASGGLWKSVNMGTTWAPLFDDLETSSIGDVVVSPSDPQIVWVGTGEQNNRQSSSFGHGVYKSEDGGASFEHMGLEETEHIGKVIVHPSDPRRAFVAAVGSLWRASPERGVFRTTNGGESWEKVLFIDDDTGVVTLAVDSRNPDVLYAAAYQRRRTPWGFAGGAPSGGIYKTTDGGDSWRKLSTGLPEGDVGRIGIDVFRDDPRLVYAIVEHRSEGGVYRSADRGESWEKVSSLNPRPMYYSHIFVDPRDEDRVYVLGASFHYSDDGGHTFVENEEMTPTYDVGVHGDHHALWVDPENSDHLVLGGDGGLYFSWDRARNWDKVDNLPLAQFYSIAVDMEVPYNIYGGAQDTHSWTGPSATRNQAGILNGDWVQINFGDGMYQQADPGDPSTVYTSSQGGNLVRFDRRTGDRKQVKPHPGEGEDDYRFHWTSPVLVSRHDPRTLYLGGNRLFVSRDRGESWSSSGDLTWNEDRDELPILGKVPDESTLSRHDGVASWGTITTIAESPLDPRVVYVGTDDGRVQLSRDGGESFESVEENVRGFDSRRATVSRIVASQAKASRAYVSFDRHQLGDFAPYVFVTEDFGKRFTPLGGGLPPKGWVNVLVEHPRNPDLLFVGTETGLFFSFDRGREWLRMSGGFPTVPVDDLVVHPRDNDLVVGTHGRSVYILDDLTALERYRPGESMQLFAPRQATIFLPWKHESYGAQRRFAGENPPFGALVTYHLAEERADAVTVTISDERGNALRRLDAPGESGFQRVVWDLRTEAPEGVGRGPLVPPGRYRVELAGGGEGRESVVDVVLDPRVQADAAELRRRYDFLEEVNALRARLHEEIARARRVEQQMEAVGEVLDARGETELRGELEAAKERILAEARPIGGGPRSFRNPSLSARASGLFGELAGGGVQQGTLYGPTASQRARLEVLEKEAEEAIEQLTERLSSVVEEINARLVESGSLRISP